MMFACLVMGFIFTHSSGRILLSVVLPSPSVQYSVQIPGTVVEAGGGGGPGVVEYVFYSSCALGAILYLPVILAVLFNRSV